jgi:hypothetical protein
LNIDTYEPDRQLAWVAHRTDDLYSIGHILRAMFLWPFVPFWLLWTVALGLKGSLHLQRPLWLRRVVWDGGHQRLVIRYGLWPLFFTGRKAVSFSTIDSLSFDLEPPDEDGVTATCRIAYGAAAGGERRLAWSFRLANLDDAADAEDLVLRIGRILKWKYYESLSDDDGSVKLELLRQRPDEGSTAKRIPSRKRSAEQLAVRRADHGEPTEKKRPRKPNQQQEKRLRRLLSCRVQAWRPGKRIALRKSWDPIALVMAACIGVPLLLVPAAFVALALALFMLLPVVGLERLFDVIIPKNYLLWAGGIAVGAGFLAYGFHTIRGFMREYGARRILIDWSARLVSLRGLALHADLAFEDIDGVLVRGPWEDSEPEGGLPHYDTRDAIELQRRGNRAPLRLFEVPHTREQTEDKQEALRKLGTQIATALGVPFRAGPYGSVEPD